MKIYVTMKTPDALRDAIETAAENEIGGSPDDDEADDAFEELVDNATKLCERWFRYGECVTLCIDTEKETCEVV